MPVERSVEAAFAAGLLDPSVSVPVQVKGQTPRRYAVYRNNVTVGLVRALEANFPAIRRLLGEAYFAGLARQFVQDYPPRSPLLFHYGANFPAHLAAQDDLAAYPYLADVARLEQLWRQAYHAADAPTLAPEELAGLDEAAMADLRLTPHPAFALLASPYAVHAIFTANRAAGAAVADPARPEWVMLTRPRFDVIVKPIPKGAHGFFSALASGVTLAEAAEQGFACDDSFDLAAAIRLMVEAGAFQSLSLRATP